MIIDKKKKYLLNLILKSSLLLILKYVYKIAKKFFKNTSIQITKIIIGQ